MQGNVAQYARVAVTEVQMAELNLALKQRIDRDCRVCLGVVDGGFRLEQFVNAHH